MSEAGLPVRVYSVPGKPHFYERKSEIKFETATMPGGERCKTVEEAISSFVEAVVGRP